jgi:hypothetical protein
MPPTNEQGSDRGIFRAIVLFAFGFLFLSSALHLSIHDPLRLHADMRSEKLLMLEHLEGTVYSAAFGSSHIHNGFDPRIFDRTVAGSPIQTRTENLAILGGSQSEQRIMALDFVKNLKAPTHKTACLVMLELNAGANLQNMHLVHPRSINIYDWPTVRFISHLTDSEMGLTQRAGRIGFAIMAAMLHYSNVGMLSDEIIAPPIDPTIMERETDKDRRGLDPLIYHPENDAYLSSFAADQQGQFRIKDRALYPGNYELIDELAASSQTANISFVYFVFPKFSDFAEADAYPDHIVTAGGRTVPIINLARPDRFPTLYKPNLWHDDAHLDRQGAAVITGIFANELKAWYAAHGSPSQCGG